MSTHTLWGEANAAETCDRLSVCLFRHEMQHFVTVLQGYMAHQVLHVTWEEFQRALQTKVGGDTGGVAGWWRYTPSLLPPQVHSLDDLCRCHSEYINQAIFRWGDARTSLHAPHPLHSVPITPLPSPPLPSH